MTTSGPRLSELTSVLIELEQHVNSDGWDQQPRLYALVDRAELVEREPELAAALGLAEAADTANSLVPVEQEWSSEEAAIDEALGQIAWPEQVIGTAIVIERFLLPAEAEAEVVNEADAVSIAAAAANHPDRQEVRLAAAVMRDGRQMCAIRIREHSADQDVLSGEALLPGLTDALAATLES